MERIDSSSIDQSMYLEHQHRYLWACDYMQGTIIDIACGEGYGSELLIGNHNVDKYYGIDISEESIGIAKKKFGNNKINFKVGSIESISLEDSSADCVISLETLEHLQSPILAIKEIKRVLKKDGIFVGSVPTFDMEELCTKTYGKNMFHKQKFTYETLENLLKKNFVNYKVYTMGLNVSSVVAPHNDINYENEAKLFISESVSKFGSYIFIASNREIKDRRSEVRSGMNIVEYDYLKNVPIQKALKDSNNRVCELEKYITHINETLQDSSNRIIELEKRINISDSLIIQKDKDIKTLLTK